MIINAADTEHLFIAFQVLQGDFPIDYLPLVRCAEVNQVNDAVKQNKRYNIILISKADNLQQLSHLFAERCVYEIRTLGKYTGISMENPKMTTIEGDEQNLMYKVIYKTIWYGEQKEIKLQTIEHDYQTANELSDKISNLKDLLKAYF